MPQQQEEPVRTGLNDYSVAKCGKHVTVYCWSRSEPGSERWNQSEALGHELAKRGFGVVTGGYGGSMAGVSKGARLCAAEKRTLPPTPAMPFSAAPAGDIILRVESEQYAKTREIGGAPVASDIAVRGVLVPGQFPDRCLLGNQFLSESVDARSMLHRLDLLSSLTRYYVALPGTMGTLVELCIIWQNCVLHPKGRDRPVILCFRQPWEGVIRHCCEALGVQKDFEEAIQYVDTPEECAEKILADYNANIAADSQQEQK
jgi:predicted Rossmann-fold nucleotide-binding protein